MLYRAYVLPKFYYGLKVWVGSTTTDLDRIDKLQKRAVRLEVFDSYETISITIYKADRKLYDNILQTGPSHSLCQVKSSFYDH